MFITDVHALGLQTGAGPGADRELLLGPERHAPAPSPSACCRNAERLHPNMIQAGCYSATLHYLKAVADMGVAAAKAAGARSWTG